MKILLWSDVHCHIHRPFSRYENGMNSRLLDGLRIIDQVTEVASDCDLNVFLGDLGHVSPYPAPVFNELYDRIGVMAAECPMLMLAGNHDLRGKYYDGDPRDIPFLKFRQLGEIAIAEVDTKMSTEAQGVTMFAFNHRREADAAELIKAAGPHDLLLMHQEVFGADNEFGYTFRGGLHPDDLKKFKWVFTGHIHKPQILNERVVVVGAPLHINFGDVGDRGFFVLDTEKDDVEVHDTKFPRFITLAKGEEAADDGNFYRPEQAKEKQREALKIPGWDEAVEAYCRQQNHMEYVEAGRKIADATPKEIIAPQPFTIQHVELENFGVFTKEEYDVDAGLHMVIGEVMGVDGRSNGAGKTTLFEGISWVIYGRTSKGVKGASVMKRDRKRGKACKGVVVLASPNGELRIERTQKANGSSLEAWFGDHHEHGGVPDVQDWITSTLGVDYDFFQQMVYFSQEQAQFFSEMGDADRKRILGTLLGTRWYEAAEKEAKAQRDAARETIDQLESDIKHGEAVLGDATLSLERARTLTESWDKKHREDVDQAELNLAEVGVQLHKAKAGVVDQRAEIEAEKKADLADAMSGHEAAVKLLKERTAEELGEITEKFAKRADAIVGSLESARAKREKLGPAAKLEAEVKAAEAELVTQRDVAKSILRRHAAVTTLKDTVEGKISKIRMRIDDITDLKTGVRCQTCGSEITEDSKEACLDEMRKELAEAEAELEGHNTTIVGINEDAEKNHAELHAVEGRVKMADMGVRGAEKLETRIAELVTEQGNINKLREAELAEKKAELVAEAAEIARDDEALRARIEKRCADKLAKLESTRQAEVTRLEERVKQTKAELTRLEKETNPHTETSKLAAEKVAAQEKESKRLRGELNAEQDVLARAEFWVGGFGREGIRAALLHDFCRVFTNEVNDTLTQMGIGMSAELSPATELKSKKGEVRDRLDYRITTATGEMAYQELSGGEKVRIDLASMLALNLIASRHFGIEDGLFGILVLDEIFSSLDEAGVEVVYQILNGFTARSIYAISHDPSMKSMFDKVLTVLRSGTESVLVA